MTPLTRFPGHCGQRPRQGRRPLRGRGGGEDAARSGALPLEGGGLGGGAATTCGRRTQQAPPVHDRSRRRAHPHPCPSPLEGEGCPADLARRSGHSDLPQVRPVILTMSAAFFSPAKRGRWPRSGRRGLKVRRRNAPSTPLRVVPLPRFAKEEKTAPADLVLSTHPGQTGHCDDFPRADLARPALYRPNYQSRLSSETRQVAALFPRHTLRDARG
jgi:hypothetical protein